MLTGATLPYLSLLLVSLLAGVYTMLHGVGTPEPDERPSRIRRLLPSLSAAGVGAAICGYILTRQEAMQRLAILLTASLVGLTILALSIWFVKRWALSAKIDPAIEMAEELQGLLAQVVREIAPSTHGEIRYELHGKPYSVAARSIEGTPIPAGTDVVIDRIEQGVASVEPWSAVEQRI